MVTYLSDKLFLDGYATNDVSFGSDNSPCQGWSDRPLCLAGKTMVGGSPTKDTSRGELDVWNWNSALDTWVRKHHITHPDDAPNTLFGFHVAMDKTMLVPLVLVVGCFGYATQTGRVYVFERADINSDFSLVTKLEASDKGANDQFGWRVAVDEINGIIAVTARGWDDPTYSNAGKIYLFEKDGDSWPGSVVTPGTEDASVVLPGSELLGGNYYLGIGLALRNGHLLATGGGQAYKKVNYWLRSSKTSWPHQQTLDYSTDVGLTDVDMDATATYAVTGVDDSDRIRLLKRTGSGSSTWEEKDVETRDGGGGAGWFGVIVKLAPDGTSVATSAGFYDDAYNEQGRAWIIPIVSDAFDTGNEEIFAAADAEDYHYFGSSLDWNGHHIAIGACGDDEAAENAGALYYDLAGEDYPGGGFLDNQDPPHDSYGALPSTNISTDILGLYTGINLNTIDAYVNGALAFTGPSTFISPYNGPSSSITATTVDGYDGYNIVFDNTTDFSIGSAVTTRIVCQDNYGASIDESWTFHIAQTVLSLVHGPYEITFDITFSGEVSSSALNPAYYLFDNGMYARLVEHMENDTYRLWTELYEGDSTFSLTVSPNLKDSYGGSIYTDPITTTPFYSSADMSNYDGKVRSWRQSNLISADSQRIYLAGTRGIDVFRKVTEVNPVRWGQILDEYGINAMFVANYTSDLVITDTVPPYVTDQDPPASGTSYTSDPILFTVTDVSSAVEIPSTTVYVNDVIAFNGGDGGWDNGYTGTITVEFRRLDFVINPPVPFTPESTVRVRVVASDLLGNLLDITYSFTVTSTTGFGFSIYGTSSFGGV